MTEDVHTAGIAIDSWKLPIFERHLKDAGYTFKPPVKILDGTLLLQVKTTNLQALHGVVRKANQEAANIGVAQ